VPARAVLIAPKVGLRHSWAVKDVSRLSTPKITKYMSTSHYLLDVTACALIRNLLMGSTSLGPVS
jgi:hypothetical protein